MSTARFSCNPASSFVCKKNLQKASPSSSFKSTANTTDLACLRLHSRPHPCSRLLASASLSGDSPKVDDAGKRTIASEKAVEGVNQQLHETARKVSHNGGTEQVKRVEALADATSEDVSAEASAEPAGSSQSDNVGNGHEEGLSAAKKMTPKADQ